jgi:hypothetical protein
VLRCRGSACHIPNTQLCAIVLYVLVKSHPIWQDMMALNMVSIKRTTIQGNCNVHVLSEGLQRYDKVIYASENSVT